MAFSSTVFHGFTSCGATTSNLGTTERFDDTANTQTGRASATARQIFGAYAFGGYGFTSCGWNGGNVGTTERFDDTANTHTSRTSATARVGLSAYSMGGYGFTVGGYDTDYTGRSERFDDTANTQTTRTSITTRRLMGAYSNNVERKLTITAANPIKDANGTQLTNVWIVTVPQSQVTNIAGATIGNQIPLGLRIAKLTAYPATLYYGVPYGDQVLFWWMKSGQLGEVKPDIDPLGNGSLA